MTDLETLKKWCKWRPIQGAMDPEDAEFLKALENLISQVTTFKAERDKFKEQLARSRSDVTAMRAALKICKKETCVCGDPEEECHVCHALSSTTAGAELLSAVRDAIESINRANFFDHVQGGYVVADKEAERMFKAFTKLKGALGEL